MSAVTDAHDTWDDLEELLAYGWSVNLQNKVCNKETFFIWRLFTKQMVRLCVCQEGKTPLHQSALTGNYKVCKFMITNQADVNITDNV